MHILTVYTGILKKTTIEENVYKLCPKYGKIKNLKHGIISMDLTYIIMSRIDRKYECFQYYVMYNSGYGL